jgi:hypothetical protein
MATVEKDRIKEPVKQGKYATEEAAIKEKNAPLIALLKKLDVKVATKS